MHVQATTTLSRDEVDARLRALCHETAAPRLVYDAARAPAKLFLESLPLTPPAAAEVVKGPAADGRVALRLMWGPLPAPFPRALVAAGLLLGLLLIGLSDRSWLDWLLAVTVGVVPLLALVVQRSGEAQIQARLGQLLGGVRFEPAPH